MFFSVRGSDINQTLSLNKVEKSGFEPDFFSTNVGRFEQW